MKFIVALMVVAIPASIATADVTWYTSQTDFENTLAGMGWGWMGTETYEENTSPSGTWAMDDPLAQGVPSVSFPTGLDEAMAVQSNLNAWGAGGPNPFGQYGLCGIAYDAGFGETSDLVVSNVLETSHDLMLAEYGGYDAVGFNPSVYFGNGLVDVTLYDMSGGNLGSMTGVSASEDGSDFLGVVVTGKGAIGRINIYASFDAYEGADNIQMWVVPEPTTLSLLLGLGGLALWRRR